MSSSHWDWAEGVIADHAKEKPFAPENGNELKYKVGDLVWYTNDAGIRWQTSVTKVLTPADGDDLGYALGHRYMLDLKPLHLSYKESSLSPLE